VDFLEICNVYAGKMIITAAKRIFNSDKICRSYSDLNFGVTFLEHSVESKRIYKAELSSHNAPLSWSVPSRKLMFSSASRPVVLDRESILAVAFC